MSIELQGLSEATQIIVTSDSPSLSLPNLTQAPFAEIAETAEAHAADCLTLASLPVGARLVVRCKADWRAATVIGISSDCIKLAVGSPRGGTYRIRRPPDSLLSFDGAIPVLAGDETTCDWRVGFVAYDRRW